MKNSILFVVSLLILSNLACLQSAAIAQPITTRSIPAPKAAPTPEPVTMKVCLTAETVRVREGAGTSFAEVGILQSGDEVTVYGMPVRSDDNGVWRNVNSGGLIGWTNARYLCEAQ